MPERFRKRPVVIDAERLTDDNTGAVAAWSGGTPAPGGGLTIATLEGDHHASPGDWVIRGVQGEFYPVKPDIFAATYEPAPEEPDA
jgi:hypothetical protein